MESCKVGLENRINAKEAEETLKMLNKQRAMMPWNLVTKLASRLDGYKARLLSSKLSRNVAFIEQTCHFFGYKYQFFIQKLCQQVSTTFSFTLGDNSQSILM